jgi:hypothetical protein
MRLAAGIACWAVLWGGLGWTQEPGRAPEPPRSLMPDRPPAERAAAARPIEATEPSLYYLKDKAGQLQAVPGFSFETFVELYKLKNQLSQPEVKPAFALEQMTITGHAAGDRAELSVRVKVRTEEERWIRVPLRLDQGVLTAPAGYEGQGRQFVYYPTGGEGYVAWIDGQGERQHQLTLKMLVPLVELGGGTRLRLLLPRATMTEMKLTVPMAEVVASASEGKLSTTAATDASTELTILGPAGDFELSWRPPEAKATERTTALEVVGAILTRIDGRTVDAEATLNVRSYGEPFERFRVRLPREAELVPRASGAYTVTPWTPAKQSAERIVEVRLARPTAGPVEVQIASRHRYDVTKTDQWLELNGFEVIEASRQWGHLAVAVVGDWHVLWGPSRGMRRVDQWPESLRYEDVVAGFEYFSQPASLTARLVQRKSHIGVEPEYLLLVDPDQVKLEAKLRYTIRGAKAFKLDIQMGPWQIDAVEPDYLVAADAATMNPGHVFSIPLQQPSTGQVELTLRAHQALTPEAAKLNVSLPQPQANSLGPAVLVVLPADNLELVPDSQAMVGLVRQQVRPSITLPERQQAPLFYRGETSKAAFAATLVVHPRSTRVEASGQVGLDGKTAQVEQKLSYTISYEPLDRLLLDVPRGLNPEKLTFQVGGQTLQPIVMGESGSGAQPIRTAVTLPKSYLGVCELTVKYVVEAAAPAAGRSALLRVPLVMPVEGHLQSNKLSVVGPPEMTVRAADTSWTEVIEESQRSRLVLSSGSRTETVPLTVTVQERTAAAATIVERLWVQTLLADPDRQDRVVFRVASAERELQVALPAGVAQGSVVLSVDGESLTPQVAGPGLVSFALASTTREHVVDLRYHFSSPQPTRGLLILELPRIGHQAWIRRLYWQLVLPRNEHVLATPAGFTRECVWSWNEFFWGRRPLLEQPELETWAGAAHETPAPEDANRYLFSAMGRVENCTLRTAARTTIVLLASGVALLAGLLFIHVPAVRHPSALLAVALLVACVGAIYPEPMLQLAQAAGLGIVLAFVTGLVQVGLARRRRRFEPLKPVLEKGSTQVYRTPASSVGPASTQSAPRAAPPASLEWDV